MKRSQVGFTLFEMMLALAIIAILAAMAVPALSHFITANHDALLQSQLLRAIQLARQEADLRGVPVSICKSSNGETCGGDWSDGLLVLVDERTVISVTQINTHHGKVYWRAYPYYRDHLRFMPAKKMSADNGTFWYCRASKVLPAFAIAISKSGNGRVVYPDDSGEIKDSRGKIIRCLSPAFI